MPYFDLVTLNQFIDDYISDRDKKLDTPTGYFGNVVSSYFGGANSPKIVECCKNYKKNESEFFCIVMNAYLDMYSLRGQYEKSISIPENAFFKLDYRCVTV